MKAIALNRTGFAGMLRGQKPTTHGALYTIDQPTIVYENNIPIMAYRNIAGPTVELTRDACRRLPYSESGIVYVTLGSIETDVDHMAISMFGELVTEHYRDLFLGAYQQQERALNGARTFPRTPFNTAVVNYNKPLPYHYDSQNFRPLMSCLMVFCSDMDGGYLNLPEYKVRFLFDDCALFFFSGQTVLHGVTDMWATGPDPYRISILFYCFAPEHLTAR